jgi:hypothetical protein
MAYKNPFYKTLHAREYLRRFPERRMFNEARRRALKEGLEFNIELEDVKIPDVCPILNIPIRQKPFDGLRIASPNSPSLDRIDNTKGYVKGNVRVISTKANTRKSDLTLEDIKRLYEYAYSN